MYKEAYLLEFVLYIYTFVLIQSPKRPKRMNGVLLAKTSRLSDCINIVVFIYNFNKLHALPLTPPNIKINSV